MQPGTEQNHSASIRAPELACGHGCAGDRQQRPEEVLGATVLQPLSTVLEKQLVVTAQALLQSQQLIHSSQLTLKLQVSGAGGEDTRPQLDWSKLNECHFRPAVPFWPTLPATKWLAAHVSERATPQSILAVSLLTQLLDSLASLTLCRGHASTPHILPTCSETKPSHLQS